MIKFEIRERDLLGRIGRLHTKSGIVETPVFLPVINMIKQSFSPSAMWKELDCKMLTTNAYLIKKGQKEIRGIKGVHKLLDYPGVIMTDSGAYQMLEYGEVDVTPQEIITFQEEIDTDLATILDVPTASNFLRQKAEYTVEETIRRAEEFKNIVSRKDIGWIGPIQGGQYLDLVSKSAKKMGSLPFDVYALGSPTRIMENYSFRILVDMILAAKTNLAAGHPFHLFGAGHPIMFALAVALGCDLFDSAAYSLFAQDDRYLSEHGTIRLGNMKYFPCSCSECSKREPKELLEMPKHEREAILTKHNLTVCFSEIRHIKQSITEGRLWEHLERQGYSHPALLEALKHLGKYKAYLEKYSPTEKRTGLLFLSSAGLSRPEIVRYRKRLAERYTPPDETNMLMLIPKIYRKTLRKNKGFRKASISAKEKMKTKNNSLHVCYYAPPFGIIPSEISEMYPLNQYEFSNLLDNETIEYTAQRIAEYLGNVRYRKATIIAEIGTWQETIAKLARKYCTEENVDLEVTTIGGGT